MAFNFGADASGPGFRYALVTPVRNDGRGLRRLMSAVAAQTLLPTEWVIVDHRSSDETSQVAADLVRSARYVRLISGPANLPLGRGGPVARLLEAGVAALTSDPEVVVKVDSDVTFGPRHMEQTMSAFAADARLGIASGTRLERHARGWYHHRPTSFHVEAQCRAYRRACLDAVIPFEDCLGWETVDLVRAIRAGWRTRCLPHNTFEHHRPIGGHGSRWGAFFAEGRAAFFVGYRLDYLLARTVFRMRHEGVAIAQIAGYLHAAVTSSERIDDDGIVSHVRREQRLRNLPRRVREACGVE